MEVVTAACLWQGLPTDRTNGGDTSSNGVAARYLFVETIDRDDDVPMTKQ